VAEKAGALVLVLYVLGSFWITTVATLIPTFKQPGDEYAWYAAVFAGGSCLLIGFQLRLAYLEYQQVTQQGTLLANQEREMNRKASLSLWAMSSALPVYIAAENMAKMQISIGNSGDKTAHDCTLILWLPPGFSTPLNTHGWGWRETDPDFRRTIDGRYYDRYESEIIRPMYRNLAIRLPQLCFSPIERLYADMPIYYRLVYEDGNYPSVDGMEPLTTVVPARFLV